MKPLSKSLSLCLALGLVLLFGSVASAGWSYSQMTVTTPVTRVVQYHSPAWYYSYGPPVYGYAAPVVTVPTLVAPPRVVYPAPVLVPRRAFVRPRPLRPVRLLWP